MQDEASQLIAEVVPISAGDRALDACAAPGGKTIAMAAAAGEGGSIVATDVRPRRVRTLNETIRRCRVTNVRVVHIDPDGPMPFRAGSFACVLVDAPCSGLGTVRRDPDIRWRREPADLAHFADAQLGLVQRVAPLVASGGHLVYSTCSSEPDENESVIGRFLATTPGFVTRPPALGPRQSDRSAVVTDAGFVRTLPFRDGLEAFFAAVLHRVPGDV